MTVLSTYNLRVARSLMELRRARMRRTRLLSGSEHRRRTVRRWVGRQLVSLGHRLANEQAMRPAEAQ